MTVEAQTYSGLPDAGRTVGGILAAQILLSRLIGDLKRKVWLVRCCCCRVVMARGRNLKLPSLSLRIFEREPEAKR